jgi:hypothetical protein
MSSMGSRLGRAAGLGYVAIFVTGIGWYGPMLGFRAGGEGAILAHLRESRLAFELSILSGAATFVAYLVTATLLYQRFKAEAQVAAGLLFAFVVGSVSLSLMAVAREMQLLPLLNAAASQELQAQVAVILRDYDTIGQLSSLFWGLWLLPLAWLAFRSGGWGRIVGVVVALGGLGYMYGFVRPLLLPDNAIPPWVQGALMVLPGATVLSEVIVTLWLLLAADRPARSKAALAAVAA